MRYRLRTLLMSVALCGAALWFLREFVVPWWTDQRQITALSHVSAQVFTEPRGQFLFRQFAGDSLSQRAVYVHLRDADVNDDTLVLVASLSSVEVLSIKSSKVTDAGLVHLERMRNLRSLTLVDTQVTDGGVKRLRRALPELKRIDLVPSP